MVDPSPQGADPPPDARSSDSAGPRGLRGSSCVGVLYFSSQRMSKGRNPFCVGFRRETEVPNIASGKIENDSSKHGKALLDFKYACMGYSMHRRQSMGDHQAMPSVDLPLCFGIEMLAAKRDSQKVGATRQDHMSQKHADEDNEGAPILPRPPSSIRPPSPIGGVTQQFSSRFIRSAGLVAVGMKKNAIRLGNSIKAMATDIFHPDRGRPK